MPGRRGLAVCLQDVTPTTLDLAGVRPPDHVWFHGLLPMIRGEMGRPPRDTIYGGYLDLQRAVTSEGHELILYPEAHAARLFRLAEDPLEMRDLSGDPDERPA